MSYNISFKGYSIISCGTLRQELDYLSKIDFLNADKILYTAPGLHENPCELEKQLKGKLDEVKKISSKVIVVYGNRCYVDVKNPSRDIDTLVRETGVNAKRIEAKSCIDMLTGTDEREKISKGQNVYWLSSGWLKYWKAIFKDWDIGKANETFPRHEKAIVLDALGLFERYSLDSPEKILEFSDWIKLNIEPHEISLDGLKHLLRDKLF